MNTIVTDHAEAIAALQPMKDRLLVRRLGPPADKSGLIWIPDIAQENTKFAEVVAIGPKVLDVKVGDEVLIPGAAQKYPDWEHNDYFLIQMGDIAGIIER